MSDLLLNSNYYEVTDVAVSENIIDLVLQYYFQWCNENSLKGEVPTHTCASDFMDLSPDEIDHVLYHAEMIPEKDSDVDCFYTQLNR